jgi:hypothetical protein
MPVSGSDSRFKRVYEFSTQNDLSSVVAEGGKMHRSLTTHSGEQRKSRFPGLATIVAILLAASAFTQAFGQCGMPKRLISAGASHRELSTLPAMSAPQPQLRNSNERDHDSRREPIVGLWRIIVTDDSENILDRVISGWTSDGLEFDQDISPILTGYVCYGTWVKLGKNTYGLTHPFFTFQDPNVNGEASEATEGQWDGNSAYFDYRVTVDKTGKAFTGKTVLKVVQGPDPYDPSATVLFTSTANLAATKLEVDKSLLP